MRTSCTALRAPPGKLRRPHRLQACTLRCLLYPKTSKSRVLYPLPPPTQQPPEDGSGETGDDGYASVGGTTAASMRAWLRHMREFTYQVRNLVLRMRLGCARVAEAVLAKTHAGIHVPGGLHKDKLAVKVGLLSCGASAPKDSAFIGRMHFS